jgi:cytochrome b subunit of formate dehydrogenase
MNPFHYAKNFFSDDYLPQQVTWAFGLFLLSLVALMAGLVLIRRTFGEPLRSSKGTLPPPGLATFERYEIGARLWHWSLVGVLLALWISGAAFYAPGIVPNLPGLFGMTWLFAHLAFGVLFIVGIVGHAGIASRLDPLSMWWFDRRDGRELAAGARYCLGLPHEIPKLGKYGVWSKMFHVALLLLALLMIVSGICLGLDTLGWAQMDQSWQRRQRLLHDLGSYGFLVLFAAHVFWRLLKKHRPQLKSIFTGTIAADTFSANHDWDRWKPHALSKTTDAGKVDHGR